MNPVAAIDVVIVNYNSGQALGQCVETLQADQANEVNVWVVDNASQDGSVKALSPATPLSIIKNKDNLGFAKACNQGARQGKAALLAFINPDCFVSSDQLKQLAVALKAEPNAALIGCRVLNEDGSLQAASRRRLPTLWRVFFHLTGLSFLPLFRGINIKGDGRFAAIQHVDAVNGSCLLVKRTVFDAINGFDEAYPLHFEDLDLFARIKQHNNQILYHPTVEVVHLKGHSKQDSKQVKRWKKQGLVRYFRQHRPKWESAVVSFFLATK